MARKKSNKKSKNGTKDEQLPWKSCHLNQIQVESLMKLYENDEKLLESMMEAKEQNPELEPREALQKYITDKWVKEVFFTMNGERCIIKRDVNLCFRKNSIRPWYKTYRVGSCSRGKRDYFVVPFRTLKEVDHVNKKLKELRDLAGVGYHQSISGWFLPPEHARHFLNFPQEIQNQILGYCFEYPNAAINPRVVTCNEKGFFRQAHYSIITNGKEFEDLNADNHRTIRNDEDGLYTELRRVYRAQMDATFLRACKAFQMHGASMLYSCRTFSFGMNNPTWDYSRPTWMKKAEYRPNAYKPIKEYWGNVYPWGGDYHDKVAHALSCVHKRVYIKALPGWAYFDPFLRFLWTIGPSNAKLLRTLEFGGSVKTHKCSLETCALECSDGLVESIQIYIPFINKLCPGVHTIILTVSKDSHRGYTEDTAAELNDLKIAFLPFLENDIRSLEKVEKLVVREPTHRPQKFSFVDWFIPPVEPQLKVGEIASDTTAWFAKRAAGMMPTEGGI